MEGARLFGRDAAAWGQSGNSRSTPDKCGVTAFSKL
jgi:hypothetical protein